ncbi:ATP-binding cassette domain-containing protein [Rhizobium sp. G187]|uniref:ATP-binding cassette domain-containing protein n=1 Tax=Rhizobium sp. G187 TaxID=3451352 RepID=UPI003EE779BA
MLEARDLHFSFVRGRALLDGASFCLAPGEVLGLSGASGGGKSTLGRVVAGYLAADRGMVTVDGAEMSRNRVAVQYVHQSSIFAVNPRWRIGRVLEEAWVPDEAMREAVGVSRRWYDRYPHEISGGELQRVALLRALGPQTRYLVADEITAMLDPITQADLWSVLRDRAHAGLGILAISHDAALLERVSSRRVELVDGRLSG